MKLLPVVKAGQKNSMTQNFDIIIIGGGATGLGCAVEAASRGYKTLLLEAEDYGSGTSSKSTKLVHGGIRYLANLDFALVKEGLEERYYFLKNAPHLAVRQSYLIPLQNITEKIKYWIGIKLYDFLAGKRKVGISRFLSKADTLSEAKDLNQDKITGGAIYFDGKFDDTRMLITLVKTFEQLGGTALNYHKVSKFIETNGKICGVKAYDKLTQTTQQFNAKFVINATGTFSDQVMDLAEPNQKHQAVAAAQGTHLVFDKEVFDSEHAILVPETSDGRVLFILPWHDKIVVGTTDVKVDTPSLAPQAQPEEIDFILATLNAYGTSQVTRKDIRSVFCGQRPLVKPTNAKNTAKISRKHEIIETKNGLITMVGGKWTIYRRMGQDTINYIEEKLTTKTNSKTENLHLFGYTTIPENYPLSSYGAEVNKIKLIQAELNNYELLHPKLPYFQAEVIYQIRHEHVRNIEDILMRRTRAIYLDANAALESARLVAHLMANELGFDNTWQEQQLANFKSSASKFLVIDK